MSATSTFQNGDLASQKGLKPRYSIEIKTKHCGSLSFSNPKISRLSLALMDMQAGLGGAASHWGGPSAFAEIVSALFGLAFHLANEKNLHWHELFHIINDAGHCENGIYALKANYGFGGLSFKDLRGFRSIESPLTGHGESHLYPRGVYLSNGPLGSTLAQAQGLAVADRLQKLSRFTVVLISDGALMEGEAKEALASIPGFYEKNKLCPFVLIASDNNKKLSGQIDTDSFSMDPSFRSLSSLGWECVDLPSGHELKSCVKVLESIFLRKKEELKKPIFVRAKTIKGYGLKEMEQSKSGGHGFPLKTPEKLADFLEEIYGSKNIPEEFVHWCKELEQISASQSRSKMGKSSEKKVKAQEGISRAMIQAKKNHLPVVSVSADLQGSTGVLAFQKEFPEHCFDLGVAESNMISLAAGLSKQGFIPVVDTFTQFGVTKGALPLFMANLSQSPLIAIFSHAGLQDAADGASHQNLSYLAQTASLPLVRTYSLSSSEEAFHLLTQAIDSFVLSRKKGKCPFTQIFFLGRETFPSSYLPDKASYQLGRSQVIFSVLEQVPDSKKAITLLASGTLLGEALEAGKKLSQQSWNVIVVNASIINHPDVATLQSCLAKTNNRLVTVEDHNLIGGMASLVAHALALKGISVDMHSLAVRSAFGRSAYQSAHLYEKEGLTAHHIEEAIKKKWLAPRS